MKKILNFISSMKLAIGLFAVIAAASLAGTLIPQEKANEFIYNSFEFRLLLVLLFLNTLACVLKRPLNRNTAGSALMHLGVPVILAGALIGSLTGAAGLVIVKQGETINKFQDGHAMPFFLTLDEFKVEKYPETVRQELLISVDGGMSVIHLPINKEGIYKTGLPGFKTIEIKKIMPDFVLDENNGPRNRSNEWNNPAILIKTAGEEGWLFAKYPEYHGGRLWDNADISYVYEASGGGIKNYSSRVKISGNGPGGPAAAIEVNRPLAYMGYTIYQHSYDNEGLKWSGLYIKKDPGVPVVYAGFILLCLGMFIQAFKKISGGK